MLAILTSSSPCIAIKALFAVTTCLPFSSAFLTISKAIPVPPINSTIVSILLFSRSANASSSIVISLSTVSFASLRFLSATCVILISIPVLFDISAAFSFKTR